MNAYRQFGNSRFSVFPPVLKSLLIINVSVYLLQYFFFKAFTFEGVSIDIYMLRYLALWPLDSTVMEQIFGQGTQSFYIWQLITYQFMHGGFMHLFFNLFALWMFGAELENLWGSRKFLTYYLLCGIGAGAIQLVVGPLMGQYAPTVGASGAIYGVLLAFGLSFPDRSIMMFPFFIPIPAKYFVLIIGGLEMLMGFSGSDGVAHFAHLGGALTGFLLMKFGAPLFRLVDRTRAPRSVEPPNWRSSFTGDNVGSPTWGKPIEPQYRETPPQPAPPLMRQKFTVGGEEITQATIDEILDKINERGYQSLTDREKNILTELSKRI
ncbi:MAG: rhomboid family intramembrane serine protease [Chloroflexota bacterium]